MNDVYHNHIKYIASRISAEERQKQRIVKIAENLKRFRPRREVKK